MLLRNSLKSLAVSSDSEPEVEPFITQTKAALVALLQELSENNLNLHLPGCRKRASSWQFQFSHRGSFDRPACLQTKNEDSGRGITTVTDKEIQSRNEARIPQNTKRQTTCSEHLTMTATLSWNRRILKTLSNFELSFWLWKSMNQQLRKSVKVAQKKRSSV